MIAALLRFCALLLAGAATYSIATGGEYEMLVTLSLLASLRADVMDIKDRGEVG